MELEFIIKALLMTGYEWLLNDHHQSDYQLNMIMKSSRTWYISHLMYYIKNSVAWHMSLLQQNLSCFQSFFIHQLCPFIPCVFLCIPGYSPCIPIDLYESLYIFLHSYILPFFWVSFYALHFYTLLFVLYILWHKFLHTSNHWYHNLATMKEKSLT